MVLELVGKDGVDGAQDDNELVDQDDAQLDNGGDHLAQDDAKVDAQLDEDVFEALAFSPLNLGRMQGRTEVELQQSMDLDADILEQDADASNEVEDDSKIDLGDDIGLELETLERDAGVQEDAQVSNEVNDDLDESIDIDLGGGEDVGWCC